MNSLDGIRSLSRLPRNRRCSGILLLAYTEPAMPASPNPLPDTRATECQDAPPNVGLAHSERALVYPVAHGAGEHGMVEMGWKSQGGKEMARPVRDGFPFGGNRMRAVTGGDA